MNWFGFSWLQSKASFILFWISTIPHFSLIYMSTGLPWPSRKLYASGSICGPELLREMWWLTGNDIHWELRFPQGALCAGLSYGPPACLLSPESRNETMAASPMLLSSVHPSTLYYFFWSLSTLSLSVCHWHHIAIVFLSLSWAVVTGLHWVFHLPPFSSCQLPSLFFPISFDL